MCLSYVIVRQKFCRGLFTCVGVVEISCGVSHTLTFHLFCSVFDDFRCFGLIVPILI